MRQLLVAVALCFGFTALAQDATTGNASSDMKSGAKQIGSDIGKVGSDVGQTAKSGVQSAGKALGLSPKEEATFSADKAFTLVGNVQNAGSGKVTIAREGLPPATLDVRKPTQVTLNGQPWQSKDLPEGIQVRTQFQLDGTTPVAVTIEATQAGSAPKKQP